jgi:hypothetical protein
LLVVANERCPAIAISSRSFASERRQVPAPRRASWNGRIRSRSGSAARAPAGCLRGRLRAAPVRISGEHASESALYGVRVVAVGEDVDERGGRPGRIASSDSTSTTRRVPSKRAHVASGALEFLGRQPGQCVREHRPSASCLNAEMRRTHLAPRSTTCSARLRPVYRRDGVRLDQFRATAPRGCRGEVDLGDDATCGRGRRGRPDTC